MLPPRKPTGFLKWAYDLPRWLYRWRLGWVGGHRFLMVTHLGRKTGRTRQTVLEVAHYDPATRECVVAAAYGSRSDWYQNIHAHPALLVQVGRARYTPVQRDLSPEETLFYLRDYERRYPRAFRWFMHRLYAYDGTETGLRELAQRMPAVAFRPASIHMHETDQQRERAAPSLRDEGARRGVTGREEPKQARYELQPLPSGEAVSRPLPRVREVRRSSS